MALATKLLRVGSCLTLILLLAGGCSSAPRVPGNAQLIWYGILPNDDSPVDDYHGAPGSLYLVNEAENRVVQVWLVQPDRTTHCPATEKELAQNQHYRLYLVPPQNEAATQPAR